MKSFKILLPNGNCVTQKTKFNGKLISDEREMCSFMKRHWCKWSDSKSFQDWADDLNNDENYEGSFDIDNALDNLDSNYHVELNGKVARPWDMFNKFAIDLIK